MSTQDHPTQAPPPVRKATTEHVAAELEARQSIRDMWRHGSPRCALTRYAETAGTLADRYDTP